MTTAGDTAVIVEFDRAIEPEVIPASGFHFWKPSEPGVWVEAITWMDPEDGTLILVVPEGYGNSGCKMRIPAVLSEADPPIWWLPETLVGS